MEDINKEINWLHILLFMLIKSSVYMVINEYLCWRYFFNDIRLCPLLNYWYIYLLNLVIIVAIGLEWMIYGGLVSSLGSLDKKVLLGSYSYIYMVKDDHE